MGENSTATHRIQKYYKFIGRRQKSFINILYRIYNTIPKSYMSYIALIMSLISDENHSIL